MTNNSHPSGLDVSSYTIEEIDSITSEYTLKNNVSLICCLCSGPVCVSTTDRASNSPTRTFLRSPCL